MARFSLVASLVIAFFRAASATPRDITSVDIHPRATTWTWKNVVGLSARSVEVSPDPPILGQQLAITVDAHAPLTIQQGTKASYIVLGGPPTERKEFDLCDAVESANPTAHCPIKKDDTYKFKYVVDLPDEAGDDEIKINTNGIQGVEEEFCYQIRINFDS